MTKLEELLRFQEYRCKQELAEWDKICEDIRKNPNYLNVYGIWVGDMLRNLQSLRVMISMRQSFIADIKEALRNGKLYQR
jgi:hypothetical protein